MKTRFSLDLAGGDWVVDCFEEANAPLVLAEVELPTADTHVELPDWCGQEVTGISLLSNAVLAKNPVNQWANEIRRIYSIE